MLVSGLTGIDIDLATAMHRTKAESHGLKPGFHKDFGAKMEVCPQDIQRRLSGQFSHSC